MVANATQIYADTVRHLPSGERLKLARLILQDIASSDIDFSDAWSKQDLNQLISFALSHSENPHDKEKKNP
jgi:hypothetical protein